MSRGGKSASFVLELLWIWLQRPSQAWDMASSYGSIVQNSVNEFGLDISMWHMFNMVCTTVSTPFISKMTVYK